DGIRDATVTGVQTCALPIFIGVAHPGLRTRFERGVVAGDAEGELMHVGLADDDRARRAQFCRHRRVLLRDEVFQSRRSRAGGKRSEERRVGKGARWRWPGWG